MNKSNSTLNKITLSGILLFLSPFCGSAEAGKGISDESIILALFTIVMLVLNQVFLIISSLKKIMQPEGKSSILHYISFVLAIIIFALYIPNIKTGGLPIFTVFATLPMILGTISFMITLFYLMKKKG
jgi:hypothetical protein